MRFILCEKQFLCLSADADGNANAEMSMTRFPKGEQEQLHNSFFQHDSKLNETMKLFTLMTSTKISFRKGCDFV